MRPPLWEDITSSIQNIDPENAIMLGSIATQVKLETSSSTEDVHMMEPLSSPLLSPLEIKTEKSTLTHHHHHHGLTMAPLSHLHHATTSTLQHVPHATAQHLQLDHGSLLGNCGEAYHPNGTVNYQPAHHSLLNGFLGGTNGSGQHHQYSQNQPAQNLVANGDNISYYGPVSWSSNTQVSHDKNVINLVKYIQRTCTINI